MKNSPEYRRARFTMRPTAAPGPCREAADALWEYLDGALEAGRAEIIRAHLDDCTKCRDRHDEMRSFLRRVAQVQGTDSAPDSLRERIDALLQERGLQS